MNFFLSFDIFTIDSFFQDTSSKKVASFPGLLVSLLVYAFLLYTFIKSDMIQKKNPKTTDQLILQTQESLIVELSNNNFFPMFSLYDLKGNSYLYFDPSIWRFDFYALDYDGNRQSIPLINCSNVMSNYSVYYNPAMCINQTSLNLSFNQYIKASLTLCSNSTGNEGKCKSDEEIYDFVKGIYFDFRFFENTLDLNDYDRPVKKFNYPSVAATLNPQFLEEYFLNLMQVEFSQNKNDLFEDYTSEFYYQQDNQGSTSDFYYNNQGIVIWKSGDKTVLSLNIYLSPNKRMITRKYQQLTDVLGILGGMLSVFKLIGGIFLSIFPQLKIMKISLMSSILFQDTKKRKTKNIKT